MLGAGYDCNLAGCAVPAIHSAHESFFQATPGYIGVRDDLHRKATFTISFSEVMLPDANFLSSRAQNRVFCALFGSGTPVFGLFEHKIGVFVLFWGLEPSFSGFLSTKLRFLCAFALRNPHFQAFRAQNRGFCALFGFGTPIFGLFEHKIGIFVLG